MSIRAGGEVVRGSAFVDINNPLGSLGNPFTVVMGKEAKQCSRQRRRRAAREAGTPETVFIDDSTFDALQLTVLTPTGAELGARVHGFMGAVAAAARARAGDRSQRPHHHLGHDNRRSPLDEADRSRNFPADALWLVEMRLAAAPTRQVDGRRAVERVFPVPLL